MMVESKAWLWNHINGFPLCSAAFYLCDVVWSGDALFISSVKVLYSFLFFFFLVGLEFELRALPLRSRWLYLSHTSSPFCSGYCENGVSRIICSGWPWTQSSQSQFPK
jgi:hypothetical protein